jgi:hypothetical protein
MTSNKVALVLAADRTPAREHRARRRVWARSPVVPAATVCITVDQVSNSCVANTLACSPTEAIAASTS